MTEESRIQLNARYLESVVYHFGLTGANTRTTLGVLTHRATVDVTPTFTDNC